MRKILNWVIMSFLVIVLMGIVIFVYSWLIAHSSTTNLPEYSFSEYRQQEVDGLQVVQDSLSTFRVVVFPMGTALAGNLNTAGAQTIAEQARARDWKVAINGGYFIGSYVNAQYSGLFALNGQVLSNLVQDSKSQVTHVALVDQENRLSFLHTLEAKEESISKSKLAFQSGPLFVQDGKLLAQGIALSQNGSGRFLRSFIGTFQNGQIFLGITIAPRSLSELGEMLLKIPGWENEKISVLNLDGGSSTALYFKDRDELSYGVNKRLPALLGIP